MGFSFLCVNKREESFGKKAFRCAEKGAIVLLEVPFFSSLTTPTNKLMNHEQEMARYAYWCARGFFRSKPNPTKMAYTIAMPPPNITGILHMGHVLNNTVQDVLARRARMQGREVCWVPGFDHASIATEAKVIALLGQKGMSKEAVGREQFLAETWRWKEKYGNIIVSQLKRLGVSCDWERMRFTMEPALSSAVVKAFVDLYERGYIYRDKRIIHWDVARRTALSNEEVIYLEEVGKLYYIAYERVDGEGSVTVATSRPETLLGDAALCVHPHDDRYLALHGKKVYVPLIGRVIPIIVDEYVDKAFGTGCLKVTPAHDANDYALGRKHNLPMINIFTEDGKLNEVAGYAVGEDRFDARALVVEELERLGQLVRVTEYKHARGYSERSNTVVEPRISTQWFVRMKELARPAIDAVQQGIIAFYPEKYVNTYMAWMQDIRDWCISRQLWWGHRIPVYHLPNGAFVVATSIEEALVKARAQYPSLSLTKDDLTQDEDVLDTWFSSWLWPFAVFEGTTRPNNEDIAYYYPTQDLVTAPEIIFFWVARMIMAGYAFLGKPPFEHVYFTGIVRDKKRQKMSKSLGNSPDPIVLIEKYSADAVRAGVLFAAPAGNDLLFDEKLCVQGSRFVHKIKHALQLMQRWQRLPGTLDETQQAAVKWFTAHLHDVVGRVDALFAQFRLSQALVAIYKLIWDGFCAHYLEMIKPLDGKGIPDELYQQTCRFFEQLMRLLHPFMPFITEEVWQQLALRGDGDTIVLAPVPVVKPFDARVLSYAEHAFALMARVRQYKVRRSLGRKEGVRLVLPAKPDWLLMFESYLLKMTSVIIETRQVAGIDGYEVFMLGDTTFFLPKVLDHKELAAQLAHQQQFLAAINKKLEHPKFLANASAAVVARERKKKRDAEKRIALLEEQLAR